MKLTLQLTVIMCVFVCLISCSRFRGTVVATVDGEKITAAELKDEMRMEYGKYDPALLSQSTNFDEFRRQALEKLVQEKILLAEAKRQGITPTKEDLGKISEGNPGTLSAQEGDGSLLEHGIDPKAWQEAQRRRLTITKLITQAVIDKIPVSDAQVEAYYQQHREAFHVPAQFRARQIIVETQELAEQILAKIKQGEDFEQLAKLHSLSPDAKRGGDLGFFDAKSYPPVFTEVCQQLRIGDVSDVIPTDYGYQIFQLLEKRPARIIPFEEAAVSIRQLLKEEGSEQAFDRWFDGLKQKARTAINDNAVKGVTLEKTS